MKRALTYTLIAGSRSCTYDCPLCISKMTPDYGIGNAEPEVNWENFDIAANIASNIYHAENVLITGKGEPTLFPAQVTEFLHRLEKWPFGKRELQTNGSVIAKGGYMGDFLRVWHDHGLVNVAVSVYHYYNNRNAEIFMPKSGRYFDLPELIDRIHRRDLEVRLSCVMLDGYIDRVEEVEKMIGFCKKHDVEQLTLRSADRPDYSSDFTAADFVDKHRLNEKDQRYVDIRNFVREKANDKKPTETLPHGAEVYGIDDLQVCISTGLSDYTGEEEIRQLIFFPNGMLTTSWTDPKGAAVLHGWRRDENEL